MSTKGETNVIIRLMMGSEICPDERYEAWGGRSYYFVQDQFGNRYSERCTLPTTAWDMLENLIPLQDDAYGSTMDEKMDFT